jgi:hypothetical protein
MRDAIGTRGLVQVGPSGKNVGSDVLFCSLSLSPNRRPMFASGHSRLILPVFSVLQNLT